MSLSSLNEVRKEFQEASIIAEIGDKEDLGLTIDVK